MDAVVWVIFTAGEETLALPRADVRRVLPLPALSHPPGLPHAIEGILDLAGVAIPVLRLDRLFGFPAPPPLPYQHLLLLSSTNVLVALLVDRVTEVLRGNTLVTPLGTGETFNDCVVGQFTHGTKSVHLLSAERLLNKHERQALSDFREIEERRLEQMRSLA